ncbi:hypothetical protein ACI2L1_16345 [Streptomyces sp. NPDC019531]|uniref:hypothetical protein n=1 Tax=Streptomyces sp. NPDC019531 TaxID=3365062 RepID=UPI00384F19B2
MSEGGEPSASSVPLVQAPLVRCPFDHAYADDAEPHGHPLVRLRRTRRPVSAE